MKWIRALLFVPSVAVILFLVGGGVAMRAGAADDSYNGSVVFSEVLQKVIDNYVDPVDSEELFRGAYEAMMASLDSQGAYLGPEELALWRQARVASPAGPGFSVLKAARTLQVVSVESGSAADEAEMKVGDQIRSIDGREVKDLSLEQSRRLLVGAAGTTVRLDLVRVGKNFRHEEIELVRRSDRSQAYEFEVADGVARLRLRDLSRLDPEALRGELDDIASRGVESLLLDLRSVSDDGPREIAAVSGLFVSGDLVRLRDRSGRLLETVEATGAGEAWSGSIAVLVNAATAGGAEALALTLAEARDAEIYGTKTYGMGAEPTLYELENGAALLVSSSIWETGAGATWNSDGISPKQEVRGDGTTVAEVDADQLRKVLDLMREAEPAHDEIRKAA